MSSQIEDLITEKDKMKHLISWHSDKCFVFGSITIDINHPIHSRIVAVFRERLKYVESELEAD